VSVVSADTPNGWSEASSRHIFQFHSVGHAVAHEQSAGPVRHIVMFSGGITSWAVARRVAAEYGTDDLTLLFADTLVEDVDLYRFNVDVAADIGVPITVVTDGRTPWQVFRDQRHIGNTRVAPCSKLLKQKPCRVWLEINTEPAATIVYVGIDWTETHRLPAIHHAYDPWTVQAPLADPPHVDKTDLIDAAATAGIKPPRLYEQGFAHNNCGGACVRGGQAQWARLLEVNPARYAVEEAAEADMRGYLNKDVAILRDRRGGTTKPLTLTVLRNRIEADRPVDRDDWGGCGCFTEQEPDAA